MDIVKELEQKLKPLIEALKQEFFNLRTNRPTPRLVENIKVEYLGQQLAIKQLGSISAAPPREIDVSVWDKNAVGPAAKAIENSGLGVTVNVDGTLIRINLPPLTDERRQELIKLVKSASEQARIKIRAHRDEANKKIEALFKEKKISEDQKFKIREQAQKSVDKTNEEIESLLAAKIKEISE